MKKILLAIGIASLTSSLKAQTDVTPLSNSDITQIMDANKSKGLLVYTGINSEFVIQTNALPLTTADSANVIKSVMTLPNAVSCVFNPSKHKIIVKLKKVENENAIKNIKEKTVPYKVYFTNYNEIIYKAI
jgi:hypothetical protein